MQSAKNAKAESRGGVCAFNCSNTDLDCKETRDERSVCCTQCSNADLEGGRVLHLVCSNTDLECTKCKGGEHASI